MPVAPDSNWRKKVDPKLVFGVKLMLAAMEEFLAIADPVSEEPDSTPPIEPPKLNLKQWHSVLESPPPPQQSLDLFLQKTPSTVGSALKRVVQDPTADITRIGEELMGSVGDPTSFIKRFLHPEIFYLLRATFLSMATFYVFSESLPSLIKRAKEGNDNALLKIVQIEKTFVAAPWAAQRIWEAELVRDYRFIDRLTRALRSRPITTRRRLLRLGMALRLAESQIKDLTLRELQGFLIYLELWEPHYNEETLRRHIKRFGIEYKRLR